MARTLLIADEGGLIWVADGVYYPDVGVTQVDNAITSTFELLDNVILLYGGFDPGSGIDEFQERDWETYKTVLSGDLEQNDIIDAYGVVTDTENISGKNAYIKKRLRQKQRNPERHRFGKNNGGRSRQKVSRNFLQI